MERCGLKRSESIAVTRPQWYVHLGESALMQNMT